MPPSLIEQLAGAIVVEFGRIQAERDRLLSEVAWLKESLATSELPSAPAGEVGQKDCQNTAPPAIPMDSLFDSEHSEIRGLLGCSDQGDGEELSDVSSLAVQTNNIVKAIQRKMRKSESEKQNTPAEDEPQPFKSVEIQPALTLKGVVKGVWFETFFVFLIIINTVVMALNAQYLGMDLGYNLGARGYTRRAEDVWPGGENVFAMLELSFGSLFGIEIVIKLLVLRHEFFCSAWNWFDSAVVLSWGAQQLDADFIANPMVLRLLRLGRLARLARVLKEFEMFDSLRVIVQSITASIPIFVWATVILMLMQMLVGLSFNGLLTDYLKDSSVETEEREQVFLLFGTFSRTMITMSELTVGNFAPPLKVLSENIHELVGYAILAYKMFVGFAVVRVITGVFLQVTFRTVAEDDELMVVQKKRAQKKNALKMRKKLLLTDTSGDGHISREEFENVFREDPNLKTWFSAQDLDADDIDLLYDFLDDGDEDLTPEDLSKGICRLKGTAKSLDVIGLMHMVRLVHHRLETLDAKIMKHFKTNNNDCTFIL